MSQSKVLLTAVAFPKVLRALQQMAEIDPQNLFIAQVSIGKVHSFWPFLLVQP